ncbi:hypothetical protein P3T43_005379 [Paraburkholderia sp. GAS41]|jgi:hypothetical protein
MTERLVPDGFPRDPQLCVVSGSQLELLVREKDGRYYVALADDEARKIAQLSDLAHDPKTAAITYCAPAVICRGSAWFIFFTKTGLYTVSP